jgi:hypothetical protein
MAAEPSRRLTYSHQLTYAENALSEQVLDRGPPAPEAVLTTAFRSAWHALLTRLHTLQVPKPAPQHSCAPLSPPRLGLTSRRGTIEQEWDRALARTLQCIDQKEHARKLGESKRAALGASKRAAPPLPQRRDTQRAKTGVNALTFNTPAASPPLGPLPPATVQPVAGQSAKGRKRQLPPNLEENHPDTRNRACVFPRAPQPQSPRYGAPHTPRHRAHEGPDRGRPRFVASSTKRADERIAYKHERQELAFAENVEEHGHMGSQDLECATHAPSPPARETRDSSSHLVVSQHHACVQALPLSQRGDSYRPRSHPWSIPGAYEANCAQILREKAHAAIYSRFPRHGGRIRVRERLRRQGARSLRGRGPPSSLTAPCLCWRARQRGLKGTRAQRYIFRSEPTQKRRERSGNRTHGLRIRGQQRPSRQLVRRRRGRRVREQRAPQRGRLLWQRGYDLRRLLRRGRTQGAPPHGAHARVALQPQPYLAHTREQVHGPANRPQTVAQ